MRTGEGNVLRIGVSTLRELEDKVKAFRTINLSVKKRRFLLSRETIHDPAGKVVISKGDEFDVTRVMLLKRFLKPDSLLKTFQPDEGIVLVSDMSTPAGVQLSMDLVTQVMNIGGGAFEAFIDRVDSFTELGTLLNQALFPRLVIIGTLAMDNLNGELSAYLAITKSDPYIRMLEITHSLVKPNPILPRLKTLQILPEDRDSWKRFIVEVIQEYTKPYSLEER